MQYFIDWEFLDDGETIMPISCGIVRHDDEELYFEMEYDLERVAADPWLSKNVLPHLRNLNRLSTEDAAKAVLDFMGWDTGPRIWAYYASHDWVLFCRLFGKLMTLPPRFPRLCFDLQQWWLQLGAPDDVKPPQPDNQHDALADARWNLRFWKALCEYQTLCGYEEPP